jgi:uncharacterized protein (TIGR02246 family)
LVWINHGLAANVARSSDLSLASSFSRRHQVRKILSAMILASSVSLAHAGPKENAYEVLGKWSKAFGDGDVDGIAKLYAPDALMIGTVGKVVLTKPEQIREYFDVALNRYKPRTAKLDSSEAIVVDDAMVVIAGFDTITGVKDGQPTTNMGRVTFVIARRGSDWLIVHLHRSSLPTP